MKLNVGRMDLRIAAIVLESGGILVMRNTVRLCPCAWIDHRRLVGLVMRIRSLVAKVNIDLFVARPRGFSERYGVLE